MGCKRAQPAWLLRWFAAMLLYYRSAGANAMLALLLNGILLGAALSCLGAVLTLPGAGRWFSKAFATLVDTRVTTLVSCVFLFFFGTPAVKGFATTLVIGLTTNLFTSAFVSRVAFDWELLRHGRSPELSVGMPRWIDMIGTPAAVAGRLSERERRRVARRSTFWRIHSTT